MRVGLPSDRWAQGTAVCPRTERHQRMIVEGGGNSPVSLAPGGPPTSPHPAGPWYRHRPWLHAGADVLRSTCSQPFPPLLCLELWPRGGWARPPAAPRAASHPGGDVNRVHALGQGALQVLQRVQALYFAAAAIDELAEGVLLEQGLHVLEEEALAEQGQFWGIMDLWGQREEVRPTIPDRTYRARPSPRPGGGKGGPRVEWQSSPLFWKLSS